MHHSMIIALLLAIATVVVFRATNPYSTTLFAMVAAVTWMGGELVYTHHWVWGLIFFIPGTSALSTGWRQLSGANPTVSSSDSPPEDSEPQQVGLVKILGRRTEVVVDGLGFYLEVFGVEILTISVFDTVLKDQEPFDLTNLLCFADEDEKSKGSKGTKVYVDAEVAFAFAPDYHDGRRLACFDRAGGYKGVMAKLRSAATVQSQVICAQNTRVYMEESSGEVSELLCQGINTFSRGMRPGSAVITGVDLGIIVSSVDFNATSNAAVRTKADVVVAEGLECLSDDKNNKTFNKLVTDTIATMAQVKADLLKAAGTDPDLRKEALAMKVETFAVVAEMIRNTWLIRDGKYSKFDGGKIVHFSGATP